ncbi:Site-specific recombinase XerD [Tardiphaga sp. OK246]|jgi:integrase|uniref:site-specific integrase n=1 Tax=Tardiphaga sp. OK246 TaxID=1855307 RepID=UPI000B65BDAF|nr:site-specific integrase [Tardiphaga sp. OK246]SNT59580.1 Site-specific recombinase XerD [Tardiphaga sp. OK246]
MTTLISPDTNRISAMGFPSIAHVPVIFATSGQYLRVENRYLRERATGDWYPDNGSPYPSKLTLIKTAYSLLNFIEWSDVRGFTFETTTYDNVLQYQREQLNGTWSTYERPLAAATANQRADEVTHFLTWAAFRGLREPFDVKRFYARRRFSGDTGPPRMVRAGRAKQRNTAQTSSNFVLPTIPEVRTWLSLLRETKGTAKYLACRCIIEVGLRRHEVEALTVSQWPTRSNIRDAIERHQTNVSLELHVTKGGYSRTVEVPMQLAISIRQWIDEKRPTYEYRLLKKRRWKTAIQLFLSDHQTAHGNPISAMTIYRAFTEVKPGPRVWTPHKGRHVFACFFILNALELEARPHGGISVMGADWAMHRGQFWLTMLRDQLGHKTMTTVMTYLRWLITSCGIADLMTAYHSLLNDDAA